MLFCASSYVMCFQFCIAWMCGLCLFGEGKRLLSSYSGFTSALSSCIQFTGVRFFVSRITMILYDVLTILLNGLFHVDLNVNKSRTRNLNKHHSKTLRTLWTRNPGTKPSKPVCKHDQKKTELLHNQYRPKEIFSSTLWKETPFGGSFGGLCSFPFVSGISICRCRSASPGLGPRDEPRLLEPRWAEVNGLLSWLVKRPGQVLPLTGLKKVFNSKDFAMLGLVQFFRLKKIKKAEAKVFIGKLRD